MRVFVHIFFLESWSKRDKEGEQGLEVEEEF